MGDFESSSLFGLRVFINNPMCDFKEGKDFASPMFTLTPYSLTIPNPSFLYLS